MVDGGLAVIFVVLVAAEVARQPVPGGGTALLALLTLVMAACLVLRRKWPLATLVIGTAALVVESFLHVATVFTPLATLVGAYSVGLYATRTRARWGLLIIVAGILGFFVGTPGLRRTDPVQLAYVLLVWIGGWAFGYARARRGEDQERVRRALEREVIAEERVRMSRELHDVVGHTVNLLVVQAGAARMTLEQDPAQARQLLKSMEDTGRETLADLDRMLATLRDDTQHADERPGHGQQGARPGPIPRPRRTVPRLRCRRAADRWTQGCGCRAILTSRRTGSSRRPSPTPSSTPPPVGDGGRRASGRDP